MFESRRPQITDELLSAYLDNAVSLEEKRWIEAAAQTDADVAWRLQTLRQTVNLLRTLPQPVLPRSFVLTEADLATYGQPAQTPPLLTAAKRVVVPRSTRAIHQPARKGFWQMWNEFWLGGSPFLRNAATAALAVWIVLFGVGIFNPLVTLPQPNALPVVVQPTAVVALASQQRAASAESAPVDAGKSADTQANFSIQSSAPAATTEEVAPAAQSDVAQSDAAQSDAAQDLVPAVAPTNAPLLLSVPVNTAAIDSAAISNSPAGEGVGGGAASVAKGMPSEQVEGMEQSLDDAPLESMAPPGDSAVADTMNAASADQESPVASEGAAASANEVTLATTVAEEGTATTLPPAVMEPVLSTQEQPLVAPIAPPQPASEQVQSQQSADTSPGATAASPTPTATAQPEVVAPAQPVAAISNDQPTLLPTATSAGAVVAMVDGNQNADLQASQVPASSSTTKPLITPWRIQLAQFSMALLAALLGALWLLSHRSQRS